MSCDCDGCDCDAEELSYEDLRKYDALIRDLVFYYQNKQYSEILERLETEYPVDLASISKLKLSE